MVKGIGSSIAGYGNDCNCQRSAQDSSDLPSLPLLAEAEGENLLCDTNHDQLDLDDIGSVRQQKVVVAAPMKRMVIQLTIAAFFDTMRADGLWGGEGEEERRREERRETRENEGKRAGMDRNGQE